MLLQIATLLIPKTLKANLRLVEMTIFFLQHLFILSHIFASGIYMMLFIRLYIFLVVSTETSYV